MWTRKPPNPMRKGRGGALRWHKS